MNAPRWWVESLIEGLEEKVKKLEARVKKLEKNGVDPAPTEEEKA
jgi:hypothetical protein